MYRANGRLGEPSLPTIRGHAHPIEVIGRLGEPSLPTIRRHAHPIEAIGRLGEPSLPTIRGHAHPIEAIGRLGEPSLPTIRRHAHPIEAIGRLGEPSLPTIRGCVDDAFLPATGMRPDASFRALRSFVGGNPLVASRDSMSDLIVNGGKPLGGIIAPSGNKNSALPIFCATLLADEPVELTNVPDITDLDRLVDFARAQGSRVEWDRGAGRMRVDHSGFKGVPTGQDLPREMRSTVLLYPPLLHRQRRITLCQEAKGCSLGVREIDPHLDVLRALGARVGDGGQIDIELPGGFRGGRHWLDYMSVTVTENFAMAAALASGTSTLMNAASEPHVQDLCNALVAMGAKIEGIGTSRLVVTGVGRLHGASIAISTDYHEVVTFLALGAITGGEVRVERSLPQHFDLIARAFRRLGVEIFHEGTTAIVKAGQKLAVEAPLTRNLLAKIEAAPWPYFSVDLLPLMIALSTRAEGTIHFWNKVYENGFSWMPELAKFGAHVVVSDPHRIIVFGNRPLRPAVVDSPYVIRAAVALTMVAASIPGRSIVRNAEIIKRAHPRFVENLRSLGAELDWK
jgi:UDP-N-acetylglucosamine 1-carboxyvinyltransferase